MSYPPRCYPPGVLPLWDPRSVRTKVAVLYVLPTQGPPTRVVAAVGTLDLSRPEVGSAVVRSTAWFFCNLTSSRRQRPQPRQAGRSPGRQAGRHACRQAGSRRQPKAATAAAPKVALKPFSGRRMTLTLGTSNAGWGKQAQDPQDKIHNVSTGKHPSEAARLPARYLLLDRRHGTRTGKALGQLRTKERVVSASEPASCIRPRQWAAAPTMLARPRVRMPGSPVILSLVGPQPGALMLRPVVSPSGCIVVEVSVQSF
jgi:hypothetical protein